MSAANPNKAVADAIVGNYIALLGADEVYANIIEFLTANYISARSDRARRFDPAACPWMVDPLLAAGSGRYRICSIVGCTGASKSEMLTQFLIWAIKQSPGDTLFVIQSDADAADYMCARFHTTVKAIECMKSVLPANQDSIRKSAVEFPHMNLWAGGANLNNLQSKSCKYVLADECWLWSPGMLSQAQARTHNRKDSCLIIAGQAGCQFDEHWHIMNRCHQHQWSFTCAQCSHVIPYDYKLLTYETIRTGDNQLDCAAITDSVRLVCPHCRTQYVEGDRHVLTGSYLAVPSNALPENIGFNIPALGVPHIPWSSLVIAKEEARDRMRVGDDSEMKSFKQKSEPRWMRVGQWR